MRPTSLRAARTDRSCEPGGLVAHLRAAQDAQSLRLPFMTLRTDVTIALYGDGPWMHEVQSLSQERPKGGRVRAEVQVKLASPCSA